jgi:hypothetical protein
MISSETFKRYLDFAYDAYQGHSVADEYRQDGKVPFMTHPLGSAHLLIADTLVPYEERERGFKILLLHDVLEDTSIPLPEWVEEDVRNGVIEMTYTGSKMLEEKLAWVALKPSFIRLLLLYDTFWSLYEGHVGGPAERQVLWRRGVAELTEQVAREYGDLRIVQIARAIVEGKE